MIGVHGRLRVAHSLPDDDPEMAAAGQAGDGLRVEGKEPHALLVLGP